MPAGAWMTGDDGGDVMGKTRDGVGAKEEA